MPLIETPATKMDAMKKAHPFWKEKAESVQDILEIRRVSPSGIFENGPEMYSKTLEIKDVNYSSMGYQEQVVFFDGWAHIIDSFKTPFKLTIFNQRRNMAKMEKNILYPMKQDAYDEARGCYNDIMQQKILVEKQGVEQHKYITLMLEKKGGYAEAEKAMNALEGRCAKEFAGLGSAVSPLSGDRRLQLLHDFYQPGNEGEGIELEKLMEQGKDWRNEIVHAPVDFQPRHIAIGNQYARALYIEPHSYGTEMEDSFLADLSALPACSVFTVDYVPVDKKTTKKVLESKYMGIEAMIAKQAGKRVKQKNFVSETSYRLQTEKEEIHEMLDAVRVSSQRFFWVGVTVLVAADSLEELDSLTTAVEQTCDSGGCHVRIAAGEQRHCLSTALPVGTRNFSEMRAMFTQSAAGFVPFATMELIDEDKPFYYGVNKLSQNPILYNRKKLMNPSGFIFGISGSGKSMTGAKLEIGSVYLTTDDDVIVIDPQNEYEDPCKAFCGTYIDLGACTDHHINPLHCEKSDFQSPGSLQRLIKDKSALMNSIAEHSMEGESSRGTKTIVDRCVKNLYQGIADLPEEERHVPTMEDFYQSVKKEQGRERKNGNLNTADSAENLALSMERFVTGALDIFNHQTNIDMDNRMLVFGIRDIDESYWGIAMAIVLSLVKQRVMHNYFAGRTTWVYFDECHYMAKKPHTMSYMIESWKTFRKFRAIPTGLTQNAIDLLKHPDMTTLVNNSQYTMFLKQSPKDIEVIATAFENISEAQLSFLKSVPPGVGIIRFGDIVISMDNQIEKSNPIYGVFNTNPYEKTS